MTSYFQPFQHDESLRRWWIALNGVSVRTKIMGIALSIVLLLGLTITLQVRTTMHRTLAQDLEERGASIAGELAARSTDLVLTGNIFALSGLLQNTLTHHEEVRYAFVVNPNDHLLAHTFLGGFPSDLLTANNVNATESYRLELLDTEEGLIWDFAIPIFEGRAGTLRLGMSERRMQRAITSTTERLLLATALASIGGILGAFLLAWLITQPVRGLVSATEAISRGDFGIKAPAWFDDEIGHLGTAFNLMVDDLAQAKLESDDYSQVLLRRNQALEAMNAVSRAVSGPLLLQEVLERALTTVLQVTGKYAAWISLLDDEGRFSGRSTCICIPAEAYCPPIEQCLTGCATREVVQEMSPLVVPLAAACPLATAELPGGTQPTCHVTVPLVARSEVLGLLSIASDEPADFGEEELQLLNAIGRQLGVAIDNSRLLQELRDREELRGHLLERVISAQEEERRRIARELHDETSQSLAFLVVGLKAAEKAMHLDLAQSQAIMSNLRVSISQTVREVQNIIYDLRPTLLDDLGLIPALHWYTESRLEGHGVKVDLTIEGRPKRLAPEIETALFRVAQEAVTNVVRHAQADQVWLELTFGAEATSIRVRDNGRGFRAEPQAKDLGERNGFGLLGIRERTTLLGGSLDVRSMPGKGTELRVWIPVSEGKADHG